jgi:hypothetical protein
MAVAAAHTTSYFVGFLGGIVLCCWIFFHRRWLAVQARVEPVRLAAITDVANQRR